MAMLGLALLVFGCVGKTGTTNIPAPTPATTSKVVDATPVVCPILGAAIKDKKTAEFSDFMGKRYYFCCPSCKPEFDRAPMKFVSGYPPKHDPNSGM